jgi:hypothetical protein
MYHTVQTVQAVSVVDHLLPRLAISAARRQVNCGGAAGTVGKDPAREKVGLGRTRVTVVLFVGQRSQQAPCGYRYSP